MARASRPKRMRDAINWASIAMDDLRSASEDITAVGEEYQEWRDNMPDGLDQSATAELLDQLIDNLERFTEAVDEVEDALTELGNTDLPRGFGRD